MFTGLIEEMGTVRQMERSGKSVRFRFQAQTVLEDAALGASVAVNGVCLTMTTFGKDFFTADVMPETVQRTTLGDLKIGDRVNLERALALGQRLGGHLVQGHVDGVGILRNRQQEENALILTIEAPTELEPYLVEKGSIAIDGVSLTIATLTAKGFQVSLIPHSAAATTLGSKKVGNRVNLEGDIIGKYVARLLHRQEEGKQGSKGLTREALAQYGII